MRIQSPGDVYHLKLPDGAPVSVEDERMDLHAQSGHVLLLKLASEMPFDECGFAGTAITHQDQLECWHILSAGHVYNKAVLSAIFSYIIVLYQFLIILESGACSRHLPSEQ